MRDIMFSPCPSHRPAVRPSLSRAYISLVFSCTAYHVCDFLIIIIAKSVEYSYAHIPLTSTWSHLRCDIGLEEEEY